MGEAAVKFTFQYLPTKVFNSIDGKERQENLLKWSMKGRLFVQTFCFDQPFQSYEKDAFVADFFKDPNVIGNLKTVSANGTESVTLNQAAKSSKAEQVPCSVLSMDFFDRLETAGIVKESGHLSKCFDDWFEDITISDELRKMLLMEESDNYDLYNDTEREEFLFRLFSHVCLGGAICQYEDVIQPYLDFTKLLYKDLVSVQKDASSGKLHITSVVFKVTAQDKDGDSFYPSDRDHIQDFAYLIIDPLKRHVNVLYHRFGSAL